MGDAGAAGDLSSADGSIADGGATDGGLLENDGGTLAPTVSLASNTPYDTSASSIAVSVLFSEPVAGLTTGGFVATNASVTALTGSGAAYSVTLSPTGASAVTLSVAASAATNAAGQPNAASNVLSFLYNKTLKTDDGCSLKLPGDCDSPVAAYSVNAKIVTAYAKTAPLFRATRIPDLAQTDVLQAGQGNYKNGAGTPDVTQVAAWIAGSATKGSSAVVIKVYDQSGNGNDATQAVTGSAPALHIDSGTPGGSSLSLIFSNDVATAHANYASSPNTQNRMTNGSNLAFDSITAGNPATATFAPSPAPMGAPYPANAPYPMLPPPELWVLPGFLITDASLPANGLTVESATATTVVLDGAATNRNTFSDTLGITPLNVWLDLPAGVAVPMSTHTMLTAVRPGYTNTQYFMTLGAAGGAAAGASVYSSFYSTNGSFIYSDNDAAANPSNVSDKLYVGSISTDQDVYVVGRNATTASGNFGEVGVQSKKDKFASTATLTGGSIGFTQQIAMGGEGSFEGYGFLVYGTAISANDASNVQATFKGLLGIPSSPLDLVVYTGASTVVGHGIDSVEAPTKRLGVDLAAQNHPMRAYTVNHLSEDLLTDLQTAGPVATQYQPGVRNVLVIHPTLSDSFGNYLSGNWPAICDQQAPLENCLWLVVSTATTLAHNLGYEVVLLTGEPKLGSFSGKIGTLTDFLNFKSMVANGWQAAGASAFVDLEANPAIGGTDGNGGMSHCPFWNSACVGGGYVDPNDTTVNWEPDCQHLEQPGYDVTADEIAAGMLSALLY